LEATDIARTRHDHGFQCHTHPPLGLSRELFFSWTLHHGCGRDRG
jgi:hypothetical protein